MEFQLTSVRQTSLSAIALFPQLTQMDSQSPLQQATIA
jgi:hypothetical protein